MSDQTLDPKKTMADVFAQILLTALDKGGPSEMQKELGEACTILEGLGLTIASRVLALNGDAMVRAVALSVVDITVAGGGETAIQDAIDKQADALLERLKA